MKSRLAILVMLCIMSIHMLSIAETVEADGIDTHGFTIDVYAINMEQMADHTSYAVTERIYFNNTGDSPFNGTLHSWLPLNATVFSSMCPSPSDTIVRVVGLNDSRCYPFTRLISNEEIIEFSPFGGDMLSYFGQTAMLQLNGSNANGSSWHSIPINITVGMGNKTRASSPLSQGITITAPQEQMDTRLNSTSIIPDWIVANQTMNFSSEVPWNQTINLTIDGLPMGWTARMYDDDSEVGNITLQSYENKTLEFVVEVPSYKLVAEIPYALNLEATGGARKTAVFEQGFLYNISDYSLWLFASNGTDVTVPSDYVHWQHGGLQMDFHAIIGVASAGESIQITIEWGGVTEAGFSPLLLAAIALLILVVVVFVFLMRRKKEPKEEDVGEEPESPGVGMERRQEVLESLKEAEIAFAQGHLSEGFYKDLKSKYKAELEEIEKAPEDPELLALREEKGKLLGALKGLQKKREDRKISEDAYRRLEKDYKKRAIEIMKQIDQRRG